MTRAAGRVAATTAASLRRVSPPDLLRPRGPERPRPYSSRLGPASWTRPPRIEARCPSKSRCSPRKVPPRDEAGGDGSGHGTATRFRRRFATDFGRFADSGAASPRTADRDREGAVPLPSETKAPPPACQKSPSISERKHTLPSLASEAEEPKTARLEEKQLHGEELRSAELWHQLNAAAQTLAKLG